MKTFSADGSVGSPHVRVGHRQDLITKSRSRKGAAFFCPFPGDGNMGKGLQGRWSDLRFVPFLEADLLANAGYTKEQFLEWFKVFNFSAMEFRQFLIENDQD